VARRADPAELGDRQERREGDEHHALRRSDGCKVNY
jgi:hypothetical protein